MSSMTRKEEMMSHFTNPSLGEPWTGHPDPLILALIHIAQDNARP